MDHGTSATADKQLARRLHALEDELRELRRSIGQGQQHSSNLPSPPFQALRVMVDDDVYGIPVGSVLEIVRYVALTRVTDVPDVVVGAVNVRGEVYAVLDARRRFGYVAKPPTTKTTIVLVSAGPRAAGVIVDYVSDVVTVTAESLREPSGPLASAHGVAAISTVDDRMLQLIDLELLLSVREWDAIGHAISVAPAAPQRTESEPKTDGQRATSDQGGNDDDQDDSRAIDEDWDDQNQDDSDNSEGETP